MGQHECPHSRRAKVVLDDMYFKYWNWLEKNKVDLVYVEAYDEHDKLSVKYGIQAYPTLIFTLYGTVFKYPAGQDATPEGLMKFMKTKFNFEVLEVTLDFFFHRNKILGKLTRSKFCSRDLTTQFCITANRSTRGTNFFWKSRMSTTRCPSSGPRRSTSNGNTKSKKIHSELYICNFFHSNQKK